MISALSSIQTKFLYSESSSFSPVLCGHITFPFQFTTRSSFVFCHFILSDSERVYHGNVKIRSGVRTNERSNEKTNFKGRRSEHADPSEILPFNSHLFILKQSFLHHHCASISNTQRALLNMN